MLKLAWRACTARGIDAREGIDGSHRNLDAMTCVSGVILSAQRQALKLEMARAAEKKLPVILCRHFDFTPTRLGFGVLQSELAPMARYFRYDEENKKWITVPFEEVYAKYRGNVR